MRHVRMVRVCLGKGLVVGLCSAGILWMASQFLGKSIPVYDYDAGLDLWVLKENTAIKQCLEGDATSYYGRHGLNKTLWMRAAQYQTNIFLFGDSFIEALNVSDEKKPDAVLTRHLERMMGLTNLVAWGIGEAGLSCAAQIVKLPKYEKVLGKPMVHVIFTTGIENDFGPGVSDTRAKLIDDPECRIVEESDASFRNGGRIRELLGRYRVNFVRDIINNLKSLQESGLIFFRFPTTTTSSDSISADNHAWKVRLQQSTGFLLKRLREQTAAPILIAYCPRLPRIQKGVVDFVDQDASDARMLQSVARRNGIDFLDLSPVLVAAYQKHQILCMGFSNGQLGYGHLNERGIEIVFSEVARYLKANYAVYTN